MIVAPVASASVITSSPPTTRLSLLASARSIPSPSAATVGPRPAEPISAFRTRSQSVPVISSTRPSAPASTSPPVHASAARAAACPSASPMRVTPCRSACSTSSSKLRDAASATTSSSSLRSTTSSAWVPIDPVDPRIAMRFTCGRVGAAMKASLRTATPDDLPAIAAVQLASARVAFAHIGPVERMEPVDFGPWLEAAETALVAVVAWETAGFVFAGGCELQLFYTHPSVWGEGVGRALLAAAEDALRAVGCEEASVYTEERNERALAVYHAAGWREDGRVQEREWLGVPIREPWLRQRRGEPGRRAPNARRP